MDTEAITWVVVVCGTLVLPMVLVPVFLHFRHERWKIKMEHEKQMRAIELGHPLPGDRAEDAWFSPPKIALAIGAGVPLGAFVCTAVSGIVTGFHEGMWIITGIVGLGGVICGTILAGQLMAQKPRTAQPDASKPYVEDDAYDVVSTRG